MPEAREKKAIYPLEGYAPPIGYALACLEEERRRTHETVANLSVKELDAYAAGFPNNIGTLLYHIADIELDWLYCEILEQDTPKHLLSLFPAYTRDEEGRLSAIAGTELAEHLQRLAVVRKALLEKLKGLDVEGFHRVRSFSNYDVNPAWVLYHLLEHEVKHGEQMVRIRHIITGSELQKR